MKKIKYLLFTILIFPFIANSQSYTIDTSWNPDSIFMHPYQVDNPLVQGIGEHADGRVFITGNFGTTWVPLSALVCFNIDGSVNTDFDAFVYSEYVNHKLYAEVSGDTLIFAYWGHSGGVPLKYDMYGNYLGADYMDNFNEDVHHTVAKNAYLLPDGSCFIMGRDIKLHSDSIYRYQLIKLKPDGHLDTSFVLNPDPLYGQSYIDNLIEYDEDRYLVRGWFYNWYGSPVQDFCRFYKESFELDTTFHSIFNGDEDFYINSCFVLPDGKIMIGGTFQFIGDTTTYGLTRLNADGSLDSSFNTFNSVKWSGNPWEAFWIDDLCPLPEGGYLVGGIFREYQGYERGSIAKIDDNGFLDTTVFNGAGFDSCHWCCSKGWVSLIKPAKNNKYYIGGEFKYYNGQRVSPVIRINGNEEFSIEEPKVSALQLYPNPAKDKLVINAESKIETIEIFNLAGVLVQQQTANTKSLAVDVSALLPGNYLLRATGKEDVWVEKFVVIR